MEFGKAIEQGFTDAPFVAHIGIELEALGPGWCEARLDLEPWHLQQTGVAHAGVIATLADHCAGAAATTQLAPGEYVVSAEFKINVFGERSGQREMVAKLNATMAVVRPRHELVPVPAAPSG